MADVNDAKEGCYTEHGVSGYGVAVKLSRDEPMTAEWVRSMAEEMMSAVACKCVELGARYIGHIKSHVRTEAGTVKADILGHLEKPYAAGSLQHPVTELYLAVNSIVHGIPEDRVRRATLDAIHEIAAARALTLVKEREHAYFDEFDFTVSKQEYLKQLREQLSEEPPEDATETDE